MEYGSIEHRAWGRTGLFSMPPALCPMQKRERLPWLYIDEEPHGGFVLRVKIKKIYGKI